MPIIARAGSSARSPSTDLSTEIRAAHLSPPRTRRRAALRALRAGGQVLIGFNAAKSHDVVDMRECHVLEPRLFALVAPLRKLLGTMMAKRAAADIQLALTDQGVDVALKGVAVEGLDAVEALTAFCERHQLARLTIDEGYGPEPRYEPRPVTISLSGIAGRLSVGRVPPGDRRWRSRAGRGGARGRRRGGAADRPVRRARAPSRWRSGARSPRPRRRATRCWR